MKKLLIVFAVLILAAGAFGQITSSAHNFSAETWNPGGEICVVCHTPHNANATDGPLWNHELTVATFDLYSSSTMDAIVGQPAGVSKLCLSCHDGTVALEAFGGGPASSTMITGDALLGTSLENDHPISFTYDTALSTTDGELYDPATNLSGLGSTIAVDMLFSGSLECASCHDVHNAYGEANLLVKSNAASALCLTCHDK